MTLIGRPSIFSELESLRDVTERFFDDRLWRPLSVTGSLPEAVPALDLYSTAEAVVAKVALPGVKSENINVTVEGDLVFVRGSFSEEKETTKAGYVQRELGYGSFSRRFRLPVPVNIDAARATFVDGMLTITLPKVEEAAPRHIAIDVESEAQMLDMGSPGGPVVVKPPIDR